MPRYVFQNGRLVGKADGLPMLNQEERARPVACPQVRGDLKAYRSPVTGQMIEGRAARREDLARNDCREVDPSEGLGGYQNERYTRNNWEAKRKLA